MIQFEVGIIALTLRELEEIFVLIANAYPGATTYKSSNKYAIRFPMVNIAFLLIGRSRGYRFDAIYYSDDIPETQIKEIIHPMIPFAARSHIRPISELRQELTNIWLSIRFIL